MSEANGWRVRSLLRDTAPWLAVCVVVAGWIWTAAGTQATVLTTQQDNTRRIAALERQIGVLTDIRAQLADVAQQVTDLAQNFAAAGLMPDSVRPFGQ